VASGSSASSILEMSETQLSVSIGGTAENLNVSPTRTFIANYVEMAEMTAPSAPASNGAYIYLDDNGSGKTRLMVRFSSGSAVQLAIQP